MDVERIELERYKVAASVMLSREFAEQAEASFVEHYLEDHLVLRVTQTIWGRKVGERVARWPADWWQAFKARWFPRWALKRWPPIYEEATIEARDLFPGIAVPRDGRRATIVVRHAL